MLENVSIRGMMESDERKEKQTVSNPRKSSTRSHSFVASFSAMSLSCFVASFSSSAIA